MTEQAKGRHGDEHQDHYRKNGPGHFQQGVMGGARGGRVGGLVKLGDHIDQQAQHEQADNGDDRHQDRVVEEMNFFGDRRVGQLHADLARSRMAVAWRLLGESRSEVQQK